MLLNICSVLLHDIPWFVQADVLQSCVLQDMLQSCAAGMIVFVSVTAMRNEVNQCSPFYLYLPINFQQ